MVIAKGKGGTTSSSKIGTYAIYYSLNLDPTLNSVALIEHVDGLHKQLANISSRSYGWRATLIRQFTLQLTTVFKDFADVRDSITTLDPQLASRIFIAQKLLTTIPHKDRNQALNFLQLLANLTVEEVSYWAWKIADRKEKAIAAFKMLNK